LAKCSLDFNFPIGRIIATADSRNPSTYLGGTWVAIQDRTIVGVGTHALDWTGGSETHTLTIAQMPNHSHYENDYVWANAKPTTSIGYANWGNTVYFTCRTSGGGMRSLLATYTTGSGNAHNNLQPSVAKYLWQRTA